MTYNPSTTDHLNRLIVEAEIALKKDDPKELAKLATEMALLSFTLVTEYKKANTEYGIAILKELENVGEDVKKVSVAEAERRADVSTDSLHDEIAMNIQAVDRTLMTVKDQLKIWLVEQKIPQEGITI